MLIEVGSLLTLFLVALLDSLLSVDNALVLAVLVEHLPAHQRTRALRYGILGAYLMRGLSIFFVSYLVHFWPLKVAGALYLLWLGFSHLLERKDDKGHPIRKKETASFWMTVAQVEWLDLTFSLDNIIATVALAPDSIWIVIFGVCISILAMRFVAGIFLRMVAHFPVLRTTAYILVVFIGAKLLISLGGIEIPEIETFVLIVGIIVISIIYERAQIALGFRRVVQESSQPIQSSNPIADEP